MAVDINNLQFAYRSTAGSDNARKNSYSFAYTDPSDGQSYTFVPDSVISRGVDGTGDNQFVFPWFLNKENLAQLGQSSQRVDFSGTGEGSYYKDDIGSSTAGFLFPTGSIPFDGTVNTFTADKGKVLGITEKDGNLVYAQTGNSNQVKYLDSNGTINTTTYNKGGSLLGDVFGSFGDKLAGAINGGFEALNGLPPIVTAAISAYNPAIGAAITGAKIGGGIGSGQLDLGDAATSIAAAYAGSQLGAGVGGATGSTAAGQLAGNTASGLFQGQDLESSLTNAAINTGANQAAGGLLSSGQPEPVPYTPPTDYSTGADYSLTGNTGGLGLQATLAPLDMSNPYSFDNNFTATGGLGFNAELAPFNPSNPYSLETNFGNLGSMGGGQGITIPNQQGATLGSIGAQAEEQAQTPQTPSSGTQNLLSSLLKSALLGNTGTGNMATTNTNNLSSLLGGLLGGAGSLMQGDTNVQARQQQADALRAAGQQAATSSQFRPVGTTTRFGSSNFQVDPATGQLISAGYNASGLAQGYQDQLAGMTSQGLMQGQQQQNLASQYLSAQQGQPVQALGQQLMGSQAGQPLTSLGQQYLGESPDAIRQRYVQQQSALLAPGQEQQLAGIRNNLFQTGRSGLATGATNAGGLAATNPEMAAYYNSLANQQRQIAAGADQAAQQQAQVGSQLYGAGTNLTQGQQVAGANLYGTGLGLTQQGQQFGQQLGTSAFSPFNQGFGSQAAIESAAQQPFNMSADLAAQFQKANAQGGALNLNANTAAANTMLPANQYNPYASLLSGVAGNQQATGALGGLLGNTGLGQTVSGWLGSLGRDVGNDFSNGLNTSNINYDYLSQIYAGGNPYAGQTWDGE